MTSPVDAELLVERVAHLEFALARSEFARRRLRDLADIAVAAGATATRRGVARVLAEEISGVVESAWAFVAYPIDDDRISFVHGSSMPSPIKRDWRWAPIDAEVPVAAVLRGELGECELIGTDALASWPIVAAAADDADMKSLLVVPVRGADGTTIAAVGLGWPEEFRIGTEERTLLDSLLAGAARSFERAGRTEAQRSVARELQRWLLPPPVARLDGLDIATFYEAGNDEMTVGGDWYDVVDVPGGVSAFVVGDVVGHDARAAAEMGQVRHVLASHAMVDGDLPAAFARTDQYFAARSPDTMATALAVSVDPARGRLAVVSAGHLPPLVIGPDGRQLDVDVDVGPPLGSRLGRYRSVELAVDPGTYVVAFTDGVVEFPPASVDDGVAQLLSAVRARIGTTPSPTAEEVVEVMRSQAVAVDDRRDDAAGLAVLVAPDRGVD